MEARSCEFEIADALVSLRHLASSLDLFDQTAATRLGIARSDLRCLDMLDQHGQLTAGDLARMVALSPAAMSAALNRLESRHLVKRTHGRTDRRTVLVAMTETAARETKALFADIHHVTTNALRGRSRAELTAIADIAQRLATEIDSLHVATGADAKA